jgi:hypothetical protein
VLITNPTYKEEIMNMKAGVHRPLLRAICAWTAAAVTTSLLGVVNAAADSVEDMCKQTDEICACTARKLKSEVGNDKYDLYETIGVAYMANLIKGMNRGDAWDAAVRAESNKRGTDFAELLMQTNAIGQAHRKAMKSCSG